MDKLLTVIVPTYNMQDYLRRCLDSLIVSPTLLPSLEVLVINDGSKDDSSRIAHEYEDKYKYSIRVIDKENGHYGSCINRGLADAAGKYVKVLDADDWFDTKELERLLEKLSIVDVDLVLTSFKIVDCNGKIREVKDQTVPSGVVFDFNSNPPPSVVSYDMHMVTWRTSFLRRINYVQTEGINYTDIEWRCCPLFEVGKSIYYSFCLYNYMIGRPNQSIDDRVMIKKVWQIETCLESLIRNRSRYNLSEFPLANYENEQTILSNALKIYKIILIRKKASKEDINRLKRFDEYLHKSCPEIWKKAGEHVAQKWLPIKYIAFWRISGRIFPLHWMRKIKANL